MNNDNNQNEHRMSRDELSFAYEDLLRNFTESEPAVTIPERKKSTPAKADNVAKTESATPKAESVKETTKTTYTESSASASSSSSSAKSSAAPKKKTTKSASAQQNSSQNAVSASRGLTEKERAKIAKHKKKQQYKAKKRQFRKQRWAHRALSLLVTAMLIVIIVLTSSALKIPLLGFVNDIIAIDRSDTPVAVYISEDMKTEQILNMLEEYDLIYSAKFCNLLMGFFGYDDDSEFVVGEHVLTAKMGVEGMLNSMLFESDINATVKITFPEGYTIDQIAEKLYSEKVISSKNILYNAVATYEFPENFGFLNSITDAQTRYRVLEGYMYPDTYEFYLGENVNSVINRFLNNFSSKWIEEYQDEADSLGMTVDEVITFASILQKEASDANQMYTISSILHNRLDSDSLRILQCDSTQDYIAKIDAGLLNQVQLNALLEVYDTYQCVGLPVGPICNPGGDAIYAALHPDDTDYYYFCHDSDGNIYTARTLDEHSINVQNYVD
ncbi:MAG: endolytic transglycosylase MltG [Ruminococcaceae bacterium]|nr:endolytic transglycosylase MltG [Oscillospiraceae bacterium]